MRPVRVEGPISEWRCVCSVDFTISVVLEQIRAAADGWANHRAVEFPHFYSLASTFAESLEQSSTIEHDPSKAVKYCRPSAALHLIFLLSSSS